MRIEGDQITLQDMNDWEMFVEDNREALEAEYGTVERAYQHAVQGGLVLGGGASPLFNICFAD